MRTLEMSDYYKSIDGVLFTSDYKTLLRYPPQKEDVYYAVPRSVTVIGEYAFANCSSLKQINLPDSVRNIGNSAFYDCNSLTEIIIPDSVVSIGSNAFYHCWALNRIVIPESVTSIGEGAFSHSIFLRSIECDNDYYKTIDGVLFTSDYKEIVCYPAGKIQKEYMVPSFVRRINKCAFIGNYFLQNIDISGSISDIEEGTFDLCFSLRSITLPDSLLRIEGAVFSCCQNLSRIECDSRNYKSIDGVLFTSDYKEIVYYPVAKKQTEYTVPSLVRRINKCAFRGNYFLQNIDISGSVSDIEEGTFASCSSLQSIMLPGSLVHIEGNVFASSENLSRIECDGEYCKSVDGVLFTADLQTLICYPEGRYCRNYILPESVVRIGKDAFYGSSLCFSSTSCRVITLSKSVNHIEETAFVNHYGLERIECDGDYYKSIDGVLFSADYKTLVFYPRAKEDERFILPDSVDVIEKNAFPGDNYLEEIIISKGSLDKFKSMLAEEMWGKLKES